MSMKRIVHPKHRNHSSRGRNKLSDYDTVYPSDMIPNDSVYPYLIITPGVYHNDEADGIMGTEKMVLRFRI